jgi:uncharacterized membrane protein
MWDAFWVWLQAHEFVAIWLEGIALVAIFALDWRERIDQRKERQEQHKETAAQLASSQIQLEALKKSADAAIEAAMAAKKSADIAGALHRPFMSLGGVKLKSGMGTRVWEIAFLLKNYGTLPALKVGLATDFFTDDAPRMQRIQAASIEIFPSSEFSAIVRFDMGEPDRVPIEQETKKLRIDVRIPYQTEEGRQFEYTAEVSYKRGGFSTRKSETKTIQT